MLTGTIVHTGDNGLVDKFNVKAVDISTTFMGKITSGSYRAIYLMSGENDDEDALWERRFDIGLSSVKVETKVSKDENGKKVKSPVNYDFFCRLASIIRYAKHNCCKSNIQGYTGLELASGEYVPESVTTYNIPFECKEGYLGTVSLKLGEICSIHLKTDDFEIDLDQNDFVEEEIFYAIKDSTPKGIQFNAEYLGFDVKSVTTYVANSSGGFYTSLDDIIKNHPEKEFDWLLQNKYIIVSDDILDEVCAKIMNHDGYVFYDTETSGLNITFKSRLGADQGDQLVGVVLTINDGESYYFPTQMKSIPNLCNGDHFYFMEHYMKPILEGKELVAHNMYFDWKLAYIYDINANIVHDTMALYRLTVGAEKKNFPMGLKELASIFLMRDSLELSDLVVDNSWGTSDVRFWDLPYELVRLYACADTDNTKGLFDNAMRNEYLQKYNATRVYEIEIAFSFAVAYQEFYGHKIDIDNLETLHKEIDKGLKENMDKMVEIVGYEFNPNSPKQLLQIMYQELGIPTQISRKTGRPTTDKDTLKYLSELTDIEGNIKYPFVKYLMDYRVFEGVRKIIDKFPELATSDGYLFSSVMQYGTTTGRVSINTPNYQSYNDPVKKNIVPRPGFWMFDTDYSSVEYRVLGNMAGNEMIKEGFKDPDFDYHAYQASRMYNVPYAAVTKKLRKAAKGINFGLPYGMGDESLGIRVFGEASPENTRKAADLRAKYFKGQEDIRDFFDNARAKGVNEGFTETYFGRRRYYHKSDFSVNAIKRQAGNQTIQGCLDGATVIEVKGTGAVPIKDMVDTHVQVWNGHDWTWGDVLYSGKKQKCIITFTNGQKFICSPEHRFLVDSLTFTDVADINPNWREDIKEDGELGGRFVRCKDLEPDMVININEDASKSCKIKNFDNRFNKVLCVENDDNFIHEYFMSIPCVVVESVEITDEWIDMYDVCNTDCGYYVADGIITHNTAADIYKLAVGRVFKRICKEGWLGKVLLTGFIHDELLGEVHNSINPMEFLKALREEFEVKIYNEDGSPWCPLYMGFGFGMSWYEAKSVELPIKLQWEFVEKYGDTGYPDWDGDGRKFCDTIPDKLRDFAVRDARNQLLDKDNQGKQIKPTLNNALFDIIKEDTEVYKDAINDWMTDDYQVVNEMGEQNYIDFHKEGIIKYLDENYHIQGLYKDENGLYSLDIPKTKETQEAIDLFCMLHDTDRSLVDIQDIPDISASSNESSPSEIYLDYEDEDDDAEAKQKRIDSRVFNLGLNLDTDNKEVMLRLIPNPYMSYIKERTNKDGVGYNVILKDYENKMTYNTVSYIKSEDVQFIQEVYLSYFKSIM